MNTPTDVQIIKGRDGLPEYAVIPYQIYQALVAKCEADSDNYVPHAVVERAFANPPLSAIRAWREHLELTQAEVAARLGITQSAYAQKESRPRLRKSSLEKVAKAMGISVEQLDF
jgi:DNA-binding XRE family transcriptional regulator